VNKTAFEWSLAAALIAGIVVSSSASGQIPGRTPTFSSSVQTVRVDALVTKGGVVVRDLSVADFELRDNGIPQQLDFVLLEQVPLDVVLVLDASESVKGERLRGLRAASQAILRRLLQRDRAALVTFNDAVKIDSLLTHDFPRVFDAISRIQGTGGTALYDAVHVGAVLGDAEPGRSLIVLFSDGADTSSFLQRSRVLDTVRSSDIVIYAVVAGRITPFLTDVAEQTGGEAISVANQADLSATFERVLDEFRERYLLGYTPKGVSKTGWHRIDVRVKREKASVKARPGYLSAVANR
jgi:Ca-activated chloride channel homolog